MNRNKLLKYLGGLLVVLVVFVLVGRKAGWIGHDEGIRVTVEPAEARTIVEIVTSSGKVQPVIEVKISPDVSGEIVQLRVKEGDFVKRGELLVTINPEIYESALARVEAALNTSRANLANARARKAQAEAQFLNASASFDRSERLFKQEAISESEFDTARAQFLVAQAEVEAANQSVIGAEFQVKSSEATLREARESLTKTNIFAPMDGTISRLDAELGERVVGTSQFAGTEIMRIANLNEMEVLVEVNENDIIRVNEGDTAIIQIEAYLNQEFKGIVTSIANSARTQALSVDQVTNFEVKIKILPESYAHLIREDRPYLSPFRPGMSATVDIQTQRAYNILSVPIQAVTTRDDPSVKKDTLDTPATPVASVRAGRGSVPKEYVFVVRDGRAVLTEVISGIQDSNFIEIKEGLLDGDEVVTGPFRAVSRTLKDGDVIKRVSREELFGGE
jgi:HlyD family secretion protein